MASTAAQEFERMTGDTRFSLVINNPDSTNAWRDALASIPSEGKEFTASTGAPYLPRNFDRLLAALGDLDASEKMCEVIWLRPSGATWGRSLRVGESLANIGDALRNIGKKVQTTLAMPRSTNKSVRQSHKRLFDRGLLLPQGHLPANMEILVIAGKVAFVNVHLPIGTHSVPVGGIVSNSRRVARIVDGLRRARLRVVNSYGTRLHPELKTLSRPRLRLGI
ncbi:hypothetical protein ATY81_26655 [Rhizobium sp. R72]|nr:hypothetical protein ATY81_26655 [Rhizobium sp. R72]OWV98975.1 hypothetical protein ATY80_26655 [Rhizobium sp. R711]